MQMKVIRSINIEEKLWKKQYFQQVLLNWQTYKIAKRMLLKKQKKKERK